MSKDINMFEKPELITEFIGKCKEAGIKVVITCTSRTYQEQTAYFAQGREPLDKVNALRKIAGLYLIDDKENSRKITWTMNSEHIVNLLDDNLDNNKARAFDFAVVGADGKIDWNVKADTNKDNETDYIQCAKIGESLGLYSGMRFKTQDLPHLQIKEIK